MKIEIQSNEHSETLQSLKTSLAKAELASKGDHITGRVSANFGIMRAEKASDAAALVAM